MREWPQELIFALLFGVIVLVQYLYREAKRMAASRRAQVERVAMSGAPASALASAEDAPQNAETSATPRAPSPARVSPQVATRPRRYSRAALMPDRRAVQDAVVIAAILQPCHAQRAQDLDR